MQKRYCSVIQKEIVTESFAVTEMTAVTSAVLFRSESKGSGFHTNERPQAHYAENSELRFPRLRRHLKVRVTV